VRDPGGDEAAPRRVRWRERHEVVELIAAAFAEDPLLRWVWPQQHRWSTAGRAYLSSLLERRIAAGEAWVLADGSAVALWEPPGGLYVAQDVSTFRTACHAEELARLDQMDAFVEGSLPTTPSWYLGILAVAPDRRGTGRAPRVMSPITGAADRAGVGISLDTGNPVNVQMYRHLGFGPLSAAAMGDDGEGPVVTVMRRLPPPPAAADASGPVAKPPEAADR
jgi:GNAT superfamily N-acetyltransferase